MDKVDSPKKERYEGSPYSLEESKTLLKVIENDPLELAVYFAVFYGLRRSEVVGLKWSAIDMENKTIMIKHVVVESIKDGKKIIYAKNKTKNKKSYRPYPLLEPIYQLLIKARQVQYQNQLLAGKEYCTEYSDYILLDNMGNRLKPDYVSKHYKLVLKKNNLREIRFHDLRHTSATMLLLLGESMTSVQEWLGHSNISTTVDVYGHFTFAEKIKTGNRVESALGTIY